jgi:hypothetical protein
MKTPKQKALELVEQFINIRPIKMSDYSMIYSPTAKQCALIVVDEILKVASFYNDSQAEVIYFKQVKQEIEKL